MDSYIEYQENTYGLITLNRPLKRHAVNRKMASDLLAVLQKARVSAISFLAITSTGKDYFCAGGDLETLNSGLTQEEAEQELSFMNKVLHEIITFPVPVICLLQGNALGGGCEIATACDIRIARENTSFGFVQTKVGILPGWGGGAILYKKVAPDMAHHWLVTANVHKAEHLFKKGWLHEVHETSNWHISKLLKPYVKRSRKQMILLKKQYNNHIETDQLALAMREETANCASLWGSKEHKAYINCFKNK